MEKGAAESATPTATPFLILEYSPNFHRHIVRMAHRVSDEPTTTTIGTVVVESFPWLDEAIQRYPGAQLQPLVWPQVQVAGVLGSNKGSSSSNYPVQTNDEKHDEKGTCNDDSTNSENGNTTLGHNQSHNTTTTMIVATDAAARAMQQYELLSEYLQRKLLWFPSQVDKMIQIYPKLLDWPLSVLQERIDFFLAPIPPRNETHSSFCTGLGPHPVDWPALFYNDGCGAGMSVAQVTHGLLTIPQILLRVKLQNNGSSMLNSQLHHSLTTALTTSSRITTDASPTKEQQEDAYEQAHRLMVFLYHETPAIVMELTQKQLSYFLQGASTLDCVTYSYLHWKGWDFDQMFCTLQALPAALEVSSEVSWEISTTKGARRSPLLPEWMDFWQVPFQMRPMHIQAMLKTHSRLSSYSVSHLQRSVDWLVQELGLSSLQIRSLMLRMPSLLGVSASARTERRDFWRRAVGLNASQFAQVIMVHPALLQYSVPDNLQPKLDFFTKELRIVDPDQLLKLSTSHPQIWGRSLDGHLRPMALGFVNILAASIDDEEGKHDGGKDLWELVGQKIIGKAPELLKFNWSRNLEPKITFLLQHCGSKVTSRLLLQTPRVLCQSLKNSLLPKLDLIQQYHPGANVDTMAVLYQSPSLLLLSKRALEPRLQRMATMLDQGKAEGHAGGDSVVASHHNATDQQRNIKELASSLASVGCFFQNNQTSSFAQQTTLSSNSMRLRWQVSSYNRDTATSTSQKASRSLVKDLVARLLPLDDESCHLSGTTATALPPSSNMTTKINNTFFLTLFVAARAYPSEAWIRGRRRSGGMAFHVPQFASRDTWRPIVSMLWKGQKMQVLQNGKTLILGYNYIRPSRCRCSLYAIRDALRTARAWIQKQEQEALRHGNNNCKGTVPDASPPSSENCYMIEIVTDSNYCLDLLSNETKIMGWGQAETLEAFLSDHAKDLASFSFLASVSSGQYYHALNVDILYPLSRTYSNLVKNYNVKVLFRKEFLHDLGDAAKLAAQLTYESVN
ncbi:hypothetical protein ACA910_021440 [Epithemia clementina (nom. ined.)]